MRTLYLLDTNTFSDIATGRWPLARQTMDRLIDRVSLAISTITEPEILFGLARKPQATRLRAVTDDFFSVVEIFPWDSAAAHAYATLRRSMVERGKALSANDTLIAAHAIATNAILVTRDAAFQQIGPLCPTVNWATDLP